MEIYSPLSVLLMIWNLLRLPASETEAVSLAKLKVKNQTIAGTTNIKSLKDHKTKFKEVLNVFASKKRGKAWC